MPGKMILVSGLGLATVGLIACASFLNPEAARGLPAAAAIAVLGAGAVLALIGAQFSIKAPSMPGSAPRLVVGSIVRSILVMALIGAGIALLFGQRFEFDVARAVGLAFPAVVVTDLVVYLGALLNDPSLRSG